MVTGAVVLSGLLMVVSLSMAVSLPLLTLLFITLGVAAGQYFNGGLSTMRSLVPPSQWSRPFPYEIGPNGSFFIAPILAEVGTRASSAGGASWPAWAGSPWPLACSFSGQGRGMPGRPGIVQGV